MALLALWAVVLMFAMPTLSRVAASTASTATPILMEMCSSMGRQVIDVSPYIALEEQPAPTVMSMSESCGYCVLVPPLLVVLLVLCALALAPAIPPAVRCTPALPRSLRNLRGLGSQAPPLTF